MDGPRWPTSPTFGIMAFHVLEIRFPRCEAACPSGGKDSPKAVGSQGWGWGSRAEDHSQGERAVSWHFILVFWLHITNDNTSETDICQYSIWKDLHKPFFGVPPIPYLVKAEGVSAEANRSPHILKYPPTHTHFENYYLRIYIYGKIQYESTRTLRMMVKMDNLIYNRHYMKLRDYWIWKGGLS